MNLKPQQHLFYFLFFSLAFLANVTPCCAFVPAFSTLDSSLSNFEDTIKYRGYRLHLTNFEVLKKTDDWVKIKFSAVNSGRMDVDFSKDGIEHWVQINFDRSLFDHKLGSLRENIRHGLFENKFKLDAGKVAENIELKVSTIPLPTHKEESDNQPVANNDQPVFSTKGGSDDSDWEEIAIAESEGPCPDIELTNVQILEQDDKWATLEYTVTNVGEGVFHLYGNVPGMDDNLFVKAFLSGVATLSKGALPIGGQFVPEVSGQKGDLAKGESYSGKVKLDIRKKTRYMKSLILTLDSIYFNKECDRTNNTKAVVLD